MPFATRILHLSRPLTTPLRSTTSLPLGNITSLQLRFPASTRLASSDYGSPTGGPISENPKQQGPNPSADKEHPGPPPPKAGHNTGASGTKAGADGHNTPDAQSDVRPSVGNALTQGSGANKGEASNKRSFSTSVCKHAQESSRPPQPKNGARPKILDESPPKDSEVSEDVKRHNEEMDKRVGKAADGVKGTEGEEVPKSFWKGDVGEKKDGRVE